MHLTRERQGDRAPRLQQRSVLGCVARSHIWGEAVCRGRVRGEGPEGQLKWEHTMSVQQPPNILVSRFYRERLHVFPSSETDFSEEHRMPPPSRRQERSNSHAVREERCSKVERVDASGDQHFIPRWPKSTRRERSSGDQTKVSGRTSKSPLQT